jgi:NAD+ kinase
MFTSVDIDNNSNRISSSFTEFAIGNGVIASSSFGSSGYFSYIDRLDVERQDKKILSLLFQIAKLVSAIYYLSIFFKRRIRRRRKMEEQLKSIKSATRSHCIL